MMKRWKIPCGTCSATRTMLWRAPAPQGWLGLCKKGSNCAARELRWSPVERMWTVTYSREFSKAAPPRRRSVQDLSDVATRDELCHGIDIRRQWAVGIDLGRQDANRCLSFLRESTAL